MMRFLSWTLWSVVAIALVWFAVANWAPVTVRFPPFFVIDTYLPLLVFLLVLVLGVAGTLAHKTARWGWRRQLRKTEKIIADLHEKLAEQERMAAPEAQESALMAHARAAGYSDLPPTTHIAGGR